MRRSVSRKLRLRQIYNEIKLFLAIPRRTQIQVFIHSLEKKLNTVEIVHRKVLFLCLLDDIYIYPYLDMRVLTQIFQSIS